MQASGHGSSSRTIFTPARFGLLLALFIFAAFPQVILGLQTFVVRDYGFFSYPVAFFQRECFWHGELPFWNPYNQCGVPFLAQWNTMPLYPPSLFYLTLPLEWSLSFFCLLHLWFAGMGTFFLARRWTGDGFAATFAGVAFAFNGFTLNLLIWPSHIATFSWMPWVVLLVEGAWREGGKKLLLAAVAGALQMLAGGPETIFMTWLFLAALWLQQFLDAKSPRQPMLWRFPFVVILVFCLSAAQLLPFLDLAAHSQRELGYTDLRWSMPGWGWVNFLVPMAFGYVSENNFSQYNQSWTTSYYAGLGTLWLAVLAVWIARNRRVWLLATAASVSFFFALGENTPVYPALRKIIPQLSFITYPVKYIAIAIFALTLLAAFALTRLQNLRDNEKPAFRNRLAWIGGILLALIGGILLWTWRFPFPTDNVHATLLNGFSRGLFLVLNGAALFLLLRKVRFAWAIPMTLVAILWLDVWTHQPNQNPSVPPWIYQPNLTRAKLALEPQPELGRSRVMVSPIAADRFIHFQTSDRLNNFLSKRLGYCADANLLDSVPKVDGFFSLTPAESDDIYTLLYSNPKARLPQFYDFMGVSHFTAPDEVFNWEPRKTFLPLVTAGQKPIFLDRPNTLYSLTLSNFNGSKIVFLPLESRDNVTVSNAATARVLDSKFGRQEVEATIEAETPAIVVIAQTYYHNWRAYVDGQPTPLLRANQAFQAVQVPAGKHLVRLAYEDRAFEVGAALSAGAWLNCLIILFLYAVRKVAMKREREANGPLP